MGSGRDLKAFGLESFSLRCATFLIRLHPEWLLFVEPAEVSQDGFLVRTLTINIHSENPEVSEPLTLAVDLDRIISVSWFPMHGKQRWNIDWVFYMPGIRERMAWKDDEVGLDFVAQWLDEFFAEQIAAIWVDNRPGMPGTFGTVSADEVQSVAFRRGSVGTVIRSWRGSLDFG